MQRNHWKHLIRDCLRGHGIIQSNGYLRGSCPAAAAGAEVRALETIVVKVGIDADPPYPSEEPRGIAVLPLGFRQNVGENRAKPALSWLQYWGV